MDTYARAMLFFLWAKQAREQDIPKDMAKDLGARLNRFQGICDAEARSIREIPAVEGTDFVPLVTRFEKILKECRADFERLTMHPEDKLVRAEQSLNDLRSLLGSSMDEDVATLIAYGLGEI